MITLPSLTIKGRDIPKAMAVFFDIVLCSRPVSLSYQILALTGVLVAVALKSNNYIGRVALYWIAGIFMFFRIWLALGPWLNNQMRLISMLVITVVLFM